MFVKVTLICAGLSLLAMSSMITAKGMWNKFFFKFVPLVVGVLCAVAAYMEFVG